ncbi:MAG: OmcA/MtrC family decaheme c-type cytochrome [Dehalococcoidales bacterium]|nr:OmcA/MtrC family decaheme c-type cytochrome [Dehalococcoidales bacterium]
MKKVILGAFLLAGLSLLAAGCQGAGGPAGPPGTPGAQGAPGPQGAPAPIPPGAGLKAAITKVDIGADRKPVVTFTITDAKDKPLKIADLDGYPSFILSYIEEDPATSLTQYVAYTVSDVKGNPYTFEGRTVQPALAEVTGRPAFDPRAATPAFPAAHPAFSDLGNGTFTYTFSTVLPEGYDRNTTHRVGGQITRATRAFVANPTLDFVPAGGAVNLTRQVVIKESCNQCHDPLAAHGGSRQDPALCITCHTSQNYDPETGNAVLFKEMVHKIHRGANLPGVQNGEDYLIVGFRQSVNDYSEVYLPQDIRNCTTCHGAPPKGMEAETYATLAPNADNWKTSPSRAACGACHDFIDWETGRSTITDRRDHPGGPQTNDTLCKSCHVADSGKEFDASVVGAHTIPLQSRQLKGVNVEIVSVTDTGPGQNPTVVFSAKDDAGNALAISELTSVRFNVNGPTTDYLNPPTTEAVVLDNVTGSGGTYTYTLTLAIPADATGTYAIGMEARRLETIIGNEGASVDVNGASYNPVVYVPVTDTVAVPRRQVVATENCNTCHQEIAFHGGGRKNTAEYCQFCHNPATVDVPDRTPERFGGPYDIDPQSINFKLLIHRVHSGEELTRDFTIYRTRGVFNFNEIGFPGDLTNCAKCHVGDSYKLPLPETAANTLAPREFYSPLGPAAAACLGCHDSKSASAHASTMTTTFGEACATCHGPGRDFDVNKVHPGLR